MQLFGIRTELIQPESDIVNVILKELGKQNLKVEDGDVLAVASKAVATVQNRLKKLDSVKPSKKAKKIAKKYDLNPNFVEIILQEADEVYGGVSKVLLALKDHIFAANAGVDQKNAPSGYVALWPKNPFNEAERIREEIVARTSKRVGVLIVDSRVTPLRMGTTGLALAVAGFEPVRDYRAERDLYSRPIAITRHNVADDLASAAHLVMGESSEQTPAVLIKNAPLKFVNKVKPSSLVISEEECLYTKYIVKGAVKEFP